MKKNRFLAGFIILILLLFGSASYVLAKEWAIVGKLTTDELVKKVGDEVTILFTVENQTELLWTPWPDIDFYYEVFDILDNGRQVGSGNLKYTQEQYVAANDSVAFAIGTFKLVDQSGKPLKPGLYRILLFDGEIKGVHDGGTVSVGASTAIRIINNNENASEIQE